LDEFSTIVRLFSLGSFWKFQKQQNFSGYFFPRKKLCINFDKNELGHILADFSTTSSGHPVSGHWKQHTTKDDLQEKARDGRFQIVYIRTGIRVGFNVCYMH
jgi:hypothetical protein